MHGFGRIWRRHGSANADVQAGSPEAPQETLTLSDAREGNRYSLAGFSGGKMLREKICSLGLNSGAEFRVLLNPGHGPVELEVRQTRLGIGRGMARQIRVKEIE